MIKRIRGQRVPEELWLQVEREYCSPPFPLLAELCQKHNISETSMTRRAKRDGWAAKKDRIINKSRISEAEVAKDLVKRQERVVADIERVGHGLLSQIEKKLKSYDLYQADALKEQGYKDLALAYKAVAETLRENVGLTATPVEAPKELLVRLTTEKKEEKDGKPN